MRPQDLTHPLAFICWFALAYADSEPATKRGHTPSLFLESGGRAPRSSVHAVDCCSPDCGRQIHAVLTHPHKPSACPESPAKHAQSPPSCRARAKAAPGHPTCARCVRRAGTRFIGRSPPPVSRPTWLRPPCPFPWAKRPGSIGSSCTACALRGHCMRTAHAEAGILTKVIRLVVTVLFPRNPFQKNEQSKNI